MKVLKIKIRPWKVDETSDFHFDFYFVIGKFSHFFAAFWKNLSFIWTIFFLLTNHRSDLLEWYEFLKKKFPSNPRVRRSTYENDSELVKIIEMLREILIFSAGFVFGLLVVLAISNFEVDINHVITLTPTLVNHNIDFNLPTGIVIGGQPIVNQSPSA